MGTPPHVTDDIKRVAAVDIGSNSFHLVVARIVAHDVQILHQMRLKVQLAEGLDDDHILSDEAIERGLENLGVMAESLHDFEPDQVRIVATYTLRKARNARRFLKAARQILPYPIEVVSGIEEARLIYLGVAHTNHHVGNRLVVDIGGGSTEIIVGEGFEPKVLNSLSLGCATFARRYFDKGRIRAKDMSKAIKHARQELDTVSDAIKRAGWEHCIGSSGTIRSVVEHIHLHGTTTPPNEITAEDLHRFTRTCIEAGHTDKLQFSGMSEQRRSVFIPGLAILVAVFEALDIDRMEYSTGALREGVIYEMEDRLADIDIRDRTAQSLVTRYVVDLEHASRVERTALELFDQVCASWELDRVDLRDMLSRASLLHEVGLQIHSRGVQTHSEYILKNVEMPGFNREEQRLLATLVGCHRKKIARDDFDDFLVFTSDEVIRLIALLRLAVQLNFKRQDAILPAITITAKKHRLKLALADNWLTGRPVLSANLEREKNHLKALGLSLSVS